LGGVVGVGGSFGGATAGAFGSFTLPNGLLNGFDCLGTGASLTKVENELRLNHSPKVEVRESFGHPANRWLSKRAAVKR
jgi:hypothetical protein